MTEDAPKIQAAYTVVIKLDGTLETIPVNEGVMRSATTYDIYQTSKQLVSEIDDFLLADRVAKAVVDALQPVPPSEQQRAKIAEALSERGIDPTKAQ
jgi:hypothetical protein